MLAIGLLASLNATCKHSTGVRCELIAASAHPAAHNPHRAPLFAARQVCLGVVHAIRLIPTALVWAYFIYMALESMPGSQFFDRMLLMFTDRHQYKMMLERVGVADRKALSSMNEFYSYCSDDALW